MLKIVFSPYKFGKKTYDKLIWCRISNSDDREFSELYKSILLQVVKNSPKVDWAFSHVVGMVPNSNEIIKIRHWLVHPKSKNFLEAVIDGTYSLGEKFGIPYIKLLKGKNFWPHTRIPINPFEIDETHAEKVLKNYEDMLLLLLQLFEGVFD